MSFSKTRRQIAYQAARLMYDRQESEYYRAKMKAGRQVCRGWVKPKDLPSNAEIRDQIQIFARLHEGDSRTQNLREMRLDALRTMRLFRTHRPRLIGSTLTGHIRRGSDIDIHVFSDSLEAVTGLLDDCGAVYDVEHKQIRKQGEARVFTHVHVTDRFPIEVTVYPSDKAHIVTKSSITGKPMQRASIAEFEQLLKEQYGDLDLDQETLESESRIDPYQIFEIMLLPLERVKQSPQHHPEGDVLYHSLQVFDLARDELPYDEEFLLAALLHDVGKAIDPANHIAAALESLAGFISPRTAWLIEHHMQANRLRDGELGVRARRRLMASEDFETLMLLSDCDRAGRQRGVEVDDVEDALQYIRDLSTAYG